MWHVWVDDAGRAAVAQRARVRALGYSEKEAAIQLMEHVQAAMDAVQ